MDATLVRRGEGGSEEAVHSSAGQCRGRGGEGMRGMLPISLLTIVWGEWRELANHCERSASSSLGGGR